MISIVLIVTALIVIVTYRLNILIVIYLILFICVRHSLILHAHWEFSDSPKFAYPDLGDTVVRSGSGENTTTTLEESALLAETRFSRRNNQHNRNNNQQRKVINTQI